MKVATRSNRFSMQIKQLSLGKRCHLGLCWGFPGDAVVKNLLASARDAGDGGSFPGSGRSPGEGNGNPLQDSCLGNPMDRELGSLQSMWLQELDMT